MTQRERALEDELSEERAENQRLKRELRQARRRVRDLEQVVGTWWGLLRTLVSKIVNVRSEIRRIRQAGAEKKRILREAEMIKSAGVFDEAWYLRQNPDVARVGLSPLLHYLRYGWREGRDPSPEFSTEFYVETYPDVRESDVNPLAHFVTIGRLEQRKTKREPRALDHPEMVRDVVAGRFDAAFYRSKNPDVVYSGRDALTHFLEEGWRQGRDPEAAFSVEYYLRTYSDVAQAGINPYYHYLITGRREGRRPLPPKGTEIKAG